MYIHDLRLFTNDLEKQRDFYTRVLGITVRDMGDGWFTLGVGASTLTFSALPQAAPAYHHFAFNIPENLFAEAKAWLSARVDLVGDPDGQVEFNFQAWNAHAIYFVDPEGNIGEFIARHDLPSSEKPSFNSGHLLNVSEIGLAVDDVPGFAKEIQSQTGCPFYHTENNDSFMPLGDERGLFILVKRGRAWYPNGTMPAIKAPLEMLVSTDEGARFQIDGPPYRITKL
jgi:catechol-2,3-dioxygenase